MSHFSISGPLHLEDEDSKYLVKRHVHDASHSTHHPSIDHNAGNAPHADDRVQFFSKPRDTSDPRIVRHPRFWDKAGNVLLQVGSTLFRLHDSNLACHSPIFADIFRNEPKHEVNGALLHCSILEWTEVKDFEVLLDAMENAV